MTVFCPQGRKNIRIVRAWISGLALFLLAQRIEHEVQQRTDKKNDDYQHDPGGRTTVTTEEGRKFSREEHGRMV